MINGYALVTLGSDGDQTDQLVWYAVKPEAWRIYLLEIEIGMFYALLKMNLNLNLNKGSG